MKYPVQVESSSLLSFTKDSKVADSSSGAVRVCLSAAQVPGFDCTQIKILVCVACMLINHITAKRIAAYIIPLPCGGSTLPLAPCAWQLALGALGCWLPGQEWRPSQ